MRKLGKFLMLTFFFFIISHSSIISAACEENQVDINSASLEELDSLYGIGPVKAQAIIDTRSFQKVDDLINVYGIGEVTLANIKTQGLACVTGEEDEKEEINQEEEKESEEEPEEEDEDYGRGQEESESYLEEEKAEEITNDLEQTKITEEEINTIVLSPKDIKSESNKEGLSKNKFAIYGLIVFCILLVFLFFIRREKNEKTEFK